MPPFIPVEILGIIISFIFGIESLLSLRLVNRLWYNAVKLSRRHYLYVDLLSKNMDLCDLVFNPKRLNERLRTLVWNIPDRPASLTDSYPSPALFREQMVRALDRMKKFSDTLKSHTIQNGVFQFPNLKHIAIHFRPPPFAEAQLVNSPCERSDHLKGMLKHIFAGFVGLHDLDELSILNIPIDLSLPPWTATANVNAWVLAAQTLSNFHLKTLRLGFLGPKIWQVNYLSETRPVPIGSNHLILRPIRSTLRHLSLSYWGFYMKNPPGVMAIDIVLPLLESLELRSCGFTSHETLDWIIKHASTLRSLKFDDCAIIYCMELSVTSKSDPNAEWLSFENEGGRVYQCYFGRWDVWFRALAWGLLHLQRFEFGSSRVRAPGEEGPSFQSEASEGPKFGQTHQFLFGLFPDRYLEMRDGSAKRHGFSRLADSDGSTSNPPRITMNLTVRCCAVFLSTPDR